MAKSREELFVPKPDARLRIYAYEIVDDAHKGLLKVGQTTRDVKKRIAEKTKTAGITPIIHLDELAERDDGSVFTDHEVRIALKKKGVENTALEWVRCTEADERSVLTELRRGLRVRGKDHENLGKRTEQAEAGKKEIN